MGGGASGACGTRVGEANLSLRLVCTLGCPQVAELAETFVKLHDHVNRMAEDLPDASVTPA